MKYFLSLALSIQDYPSIEIVRQVFEDNLVTPVFAITQGVQSYFDLLVDALSGLNSQSVQIAADSSNIIEAIETAYEVSQVINKMVNSRTLTDTRRLNSVVMVTDHMIMLMFYLPNLYVVRAFGIIVLVGQDLSIFGNQLYLIGLI